MNLEDTATLPARLAGGANRRQFLVGSAATAAGIFAAAAAVEPALANAIGAGERACCPTRIAVPLATPAATLADLSVGNAQAIKIADSSDFIKRARQATQELANRLPDQTIRRATLDLLGNPAPTYFLKAPTDTDKAQVRQELLNAGLIPAATTVEGIYPPVADPHQAPQAFWSAPGSTYSGHHPYPGGLAVHEWVNATLAAGYVDTYGKVYQLTSRPDAIDESIARGAPLWHDLNKVTVFQWNSDGSELIEQVIADTGAHHPTSGAEAIVRGMSPAFVIALLSAHDPPTATRANARLVNYLRAAAIIARVDPVAAGLLKRLPDGTWVLAQDPPHIEGYVNHLSDHDFVLSGDTAAILIGLLQQLAPDFGINPATQTARFNLFRNLVLSQLSDFRLYGYLLTGGQAAVKAAIQRLDLRQLQTP
ncbi:MAG TPA: hypothetical protein VII06_34985 [Chloroflexota bacterium]